jgi:hypothetical protein
MTPVATDVINIVQNPAYWQQVEQLLKTVKPIVDAIGNLESREANLADCMLELIRCAQHMYQVRIDDGDDIIFLNYAKLVFNHEFHSMNTDLHSLTLFLHPTCRNFAVSQAANGRTFEFMCKVALGLVRQWGWSSVDAAKVIDDMKLYYQRQAPFTGQQANSLAWWQALPISGDLRPLKALAIVLFSIVPHAGDVERLFSDLGGIQGTWRCNLTVSTFETLGKLRANYTRHLHERAKALGLPLRRCHPYMHTQNTSGINVGVAEDLARTFAWQPPLSVVNEDSNAGTLDGPESITMEDIDTAFEELDRRMEGTVIDPELESHTREAEPSTIYPFDELQRIDNGAAPRVEDEVNVHGRQGNEDAGSWDINTLLISKGIANA